MSDSKGLFVRFELRAVEDQEASLREGRPCFRDVEYIEIHVPGDKTNVPHRPATAEDKQVHEAVYKAFQAGLGEVLNGQPLKEWTQIRPAELKMLAHANVHTVEALAQLSDENAARIGPVKVLRDKAIQHLADSKASAPLEAMRLQVEELRVQLKAQSELLEQATAPRPEVRRGPGRPPKDVAAQPQE